MKIKVMSLVSAAAVALSMSFAITAAATPLAAVSKPGSACTKVGASVKSASATLKCTKVKGKLVWVAAKKATAKKVVAKKVAAKGTPIQIGMIDTLSGGNALIGRSTQEGATIAIDEINSDGGVLGRPLALVSKDEAPDTNAAVQALRDLNSAGVPFIIGFTSSADALAAAPVAAQIDSVIIAAHAATPALTTTKFVRNFARVAANDDMSSTALAAFASKRFGIRKWNVIGYDYVTGHSQWATWAAAMAKTQPDFQKGHEVFFPFSATAQLTPYITNMIQAVPAAEAAKEGLFLATFGAGTQGLIKQGASYDLMKRFKTVISISGGGFLLQARQLGADTPEMWSQYDYYYKAYKSAMNKRFVDDYVAKFGAPPATWAYHGYQSINAWKAVLEKAGNTKVSAVLDALDSGVKFASPQGDVLIRGEDHQAVVDVVVRHFVPAPSSPQGFAVESFKVIKGDSIIPPPAVTKK
jgi:branched-chain amino acid transport system substrate-binding protein